MKNISKLRFKIKVFKVNNLVQVGYEYGQVKAKDFKF